MADDNKKVNIENETLSGQPNAADEAEKGSLDSDAAMSREEQLRLEAEEKEKLEMEAIKADIERRYSLQVEESNKKLDYISAVGDDDDGKVAELGKVIDLNAFKNSDKKKPKPIKKKQKAPKETKYIDIGEKSSLYTFIYFLGDGVSKFLSFIFGNLFAIISLPFLKLHSAVRGAIGKKKRSVNIAEISMEAKTLRGEIGTSFGTIIKSLRHPLSTPSVIRHYIQAAIQRHTMFLKTVGNVVLPVISLIILLVVFSYWHNVTFALDVIYNDRSIGYISDEAVFIEAKEMVVDRLSANSASTETEKVSSENLNAGYKLALVSYDELNDARTISDKMIENSVDNLTHACGIYIDDDFICAVKNEADAKTIFYNIIKPYEEDAEKGGYVVGFLQNIDYVQGLYRDDEDVMWDASYLQEYIQTQQLVNIKKTVTSSENAEVPYATVTTRDLTKYSGYRVIRQEGVNGSKRIITTRVYVDGELNSVYSTDEVTVEPIEEIIVVGTKTTFGGVYIGKASDMGFLWPAPSCHYISSPYGWRSSGWHKGADLCTTNGTARGTPVIASRSGTVEVVQHSSSSYGNMVLINHGDGYKTRYAHMLDGSITVSVGQTVEGGQTIGRVGSTGNSSGPHLHFEVIYNGETQNPLDFIS